MVEVTAELRSEVIACLHRRFQIAEEVFASYRFIQPNRKKMQVIPKDHYWDPKSGIETPGMDFMNMRGKVPKLSTSAVALFGPFAQKNIVTLHLDELRSYCAREPLVLNSTRAARIEGQGLIIVTYDGLYPGTAFARPEKEGAWLIESLFPKGRWSPGVTG